MSGIGIASEPRHPMATTRFPRIIFSIMHPSMSLMTGLHILIVAGTISSVAAAAVVVGEYVDTFEAVFIGISRFTIAVTVLGVIVVFIPSSLASQPRNLDTVS